jgi:Leucine-rich repeat (LRR) protein
MGEGINSADGIDQLTNLNVLYLDENNLSSIDISKNTALTRVDLN